VATEPAEFTRAQKAVDPQLTSAADRVPSLVTGRGCAQDPDCQVATDPSERATVQVDEDGHDTE
jgi:hypothetical protein